MPPKKAQKMSLNEFMADSSLGSWADEMDTLPTAPAPRTDDGRGHGDRDFGRGDRDFARPDRTFPPRDEVPIPSQPPYTAFVGNLAFDLTEGELGDFFGDHKTKSVKIIKDRDEKPKGFGYVEFVEVEGLKYALSKSGSQMSNRTIRVSVAEPPKERDRPYGERGGFDDDKFSGNWRRDGPLPERSPSRGERRTGSRFDGERPDRATSGLGDGNEDWRSNRPARAPSGETGLGRDGPPAPRRSGFATPDGGPSAADADGLWSIGSKFKPSVAPAADGPKKFGSIRSDRGPPLREPSTDEPSDWRSAPRAGLGAGSRRGTFDKSPSSSTPPTPILSRKKLELTPRSNVPSTVTTPLSSPKSASHSAAQSRSNPFGAAKPIDVSSREQEVAERLEREREARLKNREDGPGGPFGGMRRTSNGPSVQTSDAAVDRARSGSRPPSEGKNTPPVSASPRIASATVRPTFSFANAAKAKSPGGAADGVADVDSTTEKVTELTI